jgi:hypothetical protein
MKLMQPLQRSVLWARGDWQAIASVAILLLIAAYFWYYQRYLQENPKAWEGPQQGTVEMTTALVGLAVLFIMGALMLRRIMQAN